jgi:hypothetical protein
LNRRSLISGFVATSILAALAAAGPAIAAPARPCFGVVGSPGFGSADAHLLGVDAISATDAWAVGTAAAGSRTLREHWDGARWTAVPGPDPGLSNTLEEVSAVSTNDVWAAGTATEGLRERPLVQHWDGTSWSLSPITGTLGLLGVDAFSAGEVWAVGELLTIWHWDGAAWSPVPHPPLEDGDLHAVSAVAEDDVWMVGALDSEAGGEDPLVLHWDGTVVSRTSTPPVVADDAKLIGVSASSANDVWAVGETDLGGFKRTLVEHWDGDSWTLMPSPNPGADTNEFVDVSAISATDVWAAGTWGEGGVEHPMLAHWNGVSWTNVPVQEPSGSDTVTTFEGLTAQGSRSLWAVGAHGPADDSLDPLIEHSRTCAGG